MTTTAGVLALVSEAGLRDEVDRIGAAACTRVVHSDPAAPITRKTWAAACAVILDGQSALRAAKVGFPRRSDVFVVAYCATDEGGLDADILTAAIAIGARHVFVVPGQAAELVRALSGLGDLSGPARGGGSVAAVTGGRGGGGASLFAAAMALSATGSLLVDLDPCSGGIDLLLGAEAVSGLRWPDIAVQDGRLSWSAVREALPHHRGISILSGSRRAHDITAGAADAVIDAGRRAGATVVCDLPRHRSDAVLSALDTADLVVVVASCDVRSCSAAAALTPALITVNPNVGLVVRGPSPGGLRPAEVADIVGLPLLSAMRPEPLLAEKLERGGLRLGPRSPLAVAAREVLAVLKESPKTPQERAA